MKRTFFILATLLLTMSLSAQEHLNFIDLPIDGPLNKFVEELTLRGIAPVRNVDDNIVMLQSIVNGQPIDYLAVASEDAQHVYRVVVLTQPKMNWRWIRKEYLYYKKHLTEIYGEPTKYVETFMAPYNTKKALRRHQLPAIIEGKAQWATFFTVKNDAEEETGSVMVQITPSGSLARVIIVYEDAANAALYDPKNTKN